MTILQLISVLVAIAALFGWISARWLRLPTTIGTMFLTVVSPYSWWAVGEYALGLRPWATRLVQQIDFERLILHGMLPLLLFAGAFLLDIESLAREKLTVAIAGCRRERCSPPLRLQRLMHLDACRRLASMRLGFSACCLAR